MTIQYIDRLIVRYPSIAEVWLIGSRANGTAKESSDWDYIVVVDQNTLTEMLEDTGILASGIDLLIVYDSNNFQSPWQENGRYKRGSLEDWRFARTSDREATYRATKASTTDDFNVVVTTQRAQLIWPAA